MTINKEDADMAHAERDADPERWRQYPESEGLEQAYTRFHESDPQTPTPGARREEVEAPLEEAEEQPPPPHRDGRHMSAASSVSSIFTVERESIRAGTRQRPSRLDSRLTTTETKMGMEKIFMEYLDRHPTAVKRIQDHRLQHSLTVGTTKAGRSESQQLPAFGGGKPYPAPLPEQEEYVVEFEGHDDPRHAQNWRKSGLAVSPRRLLTADSYPSSQEEVDHLCDYDLRRISRYIRVFGLFPSNDRCWSRVPRGQRSDRPRNLTIRFRLCSWTSRLRPHVRTVRSTCARYLRRRRLRHLQHSRSRRKGYVHRRL